MLLELAGMFTKSGMGQPAPQANATSVPFYNNAGITFGNSEGISGSPSNAVASVTPSRQETGGYNALPESNIPGFSSGGNNYTLYILGALVLIGGFFVLKKH